MVVLGTAALAVGGLTILAAVNFAEGQRKAAAFSLSPSSKASPTATPVVRNDLQTACRLRTVAPRGMDVWSAAAGTQAGYRAHETFMDIQLPHEAVARTDQVAGQLLIVSIDASHVAIQSGCFAVELDNLTSIDTLLIPGGPTAQDRDGLYRDILETGTYPHAVLHLQRTVIPVFGSKPQRFTVAGDLTIKSTTKPSTMTVEAQTTPNGVQAVGTLKIDSREYGVGLPDGPIMVDPHLTLEFLLTLEQLPRAGLQQEAD